MIRLIGNVTARAPITVSYFQQEGLPRSPHGEALLNGGTFRGPLRKSCYKSLRRALADSGDEAAVFSLADAYMLGEGVDVTNSVSAESTEAADPVTEARLRATNPMLDLFGRWKLAGRLSVGELRTPAKNVMTIGAGARVDLFERDASEAEYLSDEDQAKLLSLIDSERSSQREIDACKAEIRELKKKAREADAPDKKALYAEIDQRESDIKDIKASREGAADSIKHPLDGVEAIAPGSEMSHRMTLINGQSNDLGLLLMGLAEMARNPVLGGRRHIGCGFFTAQYDVQQWLGGSLAPQNIGNIEINDDGFVIQGEALESAYRDLISNLSTYDFKIMTRAQARELVK